MNIQVQYRDDNIEAIMSNKYKLLVVSIEGLSLVTNLVDYEAPAKFLKIDNTRKKIFIRKCIVKLSNKLLETNKE
jgi:hypothetical protein